MAHISRRAGRSPDDVENDVVDVLDDEPVFALPVSRELLARLTGKALGLRLQFPDAPVRRQWFISLVGECRRHPDGLAALASAVSVMDHGGRMSSVLVALAREYADVAGENASRPEARPAEAPESGGHATTAATPVRPGEAPAAPPTRAPSPVPFPRVSAVPPARSPAGTFPEQLTENDAFGEAIRDRQLLARAGLPRKAGSSGGEGGLARPHEPEQLGLSQAELAMLARVFHRMTAARQLLAAAGLAPERQPSSSGLTPAEFWGEVDHLLAAGALHGGRRRVLAAAAALCPANPVFSSQPA